MQHGRKRLVTVIASATIVAGIGLMPGSPAQAEPEIEEVQKQVDDLYRQAEQASERFNDARIELTELNKQLATLRSDEKRQGVELSAVQDRVADSLVAQLEGQGIAAAGQAFVSDDPSQFLSQMTTMATFNSVQGHLLGQYDTEVAALEIRRSATEKRAEAVEAIKDDLAAEKTTIDTKHGEAEALLEKLEDEERRELLSRNSTRVPSSVPASGRAAAAVKYAMAQVGDAYVYGAAGPNAFDCSGLTMMAWGQSGIGLPHSSSAQFNTGTRVAEGDLIPGDLVFYYSPISHVGMYIGNGMIVHAANPGAGVKVSPLHEMPYVGAVRPG